MTPKQTVQVGLFFLIGIFAVAATGWCQQLAPIRLAYVSPTITNALIWIRAVLSESAVPFRSRGNGRARTGSTSYRLRV